MPLSEFFFGAQLAEKAANKLRGRGKITDENIQGGKMKKNNKTEDRESIEDIFDYINRELSEYILEQEDYCHNLCLAFKKPLWLV